VAPVAAQLRVVGAPAAIDAGLAANELITGGTTTVTVLLCDTLPAAFVAERV
jgi:hypothetical protein